MSATEIPPFTESPSFYGWNSPRTYFMSDLTPWLDRHIDDWDYRLLVIHQQLPEDFIDRVADRLDWRLVSTYRKLSEDMIRKYKDRVYWDFIAQYQVLSEYFIECFIKELDLAIINDHQDLTDDFREKHNICEPDDTWRFVD
jgi:hypothetical protein